MEDKKLPTSHDVLGIFKDNNMDKVEEIKYLRSIARALWTIAILILITSLWIISLWKG